MAIPKDILFKRTAFIYSDTENADQLICEINMFNERMSSGRVILHTMNRIRDIFLIAFPVGLFLIIFFNFNTKLLLSPIPLILVFAVNIAGYIYGAMKPNLLVPTATALAFVYITPFTLIMLPINVILWFQYSHNEKKAKSYPEYPKFLDIHVIIERTNKPGPNDERYI